jgi:hypothetical protein
MCLGPSLGVQGKLLRHAQHLLADFREHRGVRPMIERLRDPVRDLPHLRFFHAACSYCWSANANAAWLHRRIRIERNRILIDRNAGLT